MDRKLTLEIEELEERIAPGIPLGALGGGNAMVSLAHENCSCPPPNHVLTLGGNQIADVAEAATGGLERAVAGGG